MLLDETAPEGLGRHPWDFRPPVVLSTRASLELGYEPVGTCAATIPHQIDWLLGSAASGADPVAHDPFFEQFIDYRREDRLINP